MRNKREKHVLIEEGSHFKGRHPSYLWNNSKGIEENG
jgi:hypothetical protein